MPYPIEHLRKQGHVIMAHRESHRVYSQREQMIGGEAEFGMHQMQEAARQQPGADQEHERHRKFASHENFSHSSSRAARAMRQTGGLQRIVNLYAGRRYGWNDSKQDAG